MAPRVPPINVKAPFAVVVTMVLATLFSIHLIGPAVAAPGDAEVTDVRFDNSKFADGSQQKIAVDWKISGDASNPVVISIDLPDELRGYTDTFPMKAAGNKTAGTCAISDTKVVCTVDEDFIKNNPVDVSGTFTFNASTNFSNKTEEEHTINIGGFDNTVIVTPDTRTCTGECEYRGTAAAKSGSYSADSDEIMWTLRIPAPAQGIPAGREITVIDKLAEQGYEIVKDGTYPRVLESGFLYIDRYGREVPNFDHVRKSGVVWSDNDQTVTFKSVAGKGRNAALGEGKRGTDGSFYVIQIKAKALTPGEDDGKGNRVFDNAFSYSIDGTEPRSVEGSATRYGGDSTVVGSNYGRFSVTKDLETDSTLNPAFEVTYSYTEPGGQKQTKTETIRNGESFTSAEIYRGTTVTIEEVKPTKPDNIEWADPVFVDADGNPVTTLTFSDENRNLGTVTKLRLKNVATLKKDTFTAKKNLINSGNLPLPDETHFTLNYSYPADEAKGIPAGKGALELPANGEAVTSPELPVGVVVTFDEATPDAVNGGTWEEPKLSPMTLTVGEDDGTDAVVVTNTLAPDETDESDAQASADGVESEATADTAGGEANSDTTAEGGVEVDADASGDEATATAEGADDADADSSENGAEPDADASGGETTAEVDAEGTDGVDSTDSADANGSDDPGSANDADASDVEATTTAEGADSTDSADAEGSDDSSAADGTEADTAASGDEAAEDAGANGAEDASETDAEASGDETAADADNADAEGSDDSSTADGTEADTAASGDETTEAADANGSEDGSEADAGADGSDAATSGDEANSGANAEGADANGSDESGAADGAEATEDAGADTSEDSSTADAGADNSDRDGWAGTEAADSGSDADGTQADADSGDEASNGEDAEAYGRTSADSEAAASGGSSDGVISADSMDSDSDGNHDTSDSEDSAEAGGTGGYLPRTGAEIGSLAAGIALLVIGAGAIAVTIRRQKSS